MAKAAPGQEIDSANLRFRSYPGKGCSKGKLNVGIINGPGGAPAQHSSFNWELDGVRQDVPAWIQEPGRVQVDDSTATERIEVELDAMQDGGVMGSVKWRRL